MTTFTCRTSPGLQVYGTSEPCRFVDGLFETTDAGQLETLRGLDESYGVVEVKDGDRAPDLGRDNAAAQIGGMSADGVLSWVLEPAGLTVDDLDRELTDEEKARASEARPVILSRAQAALDIERAKSPVDLDEDLVETLEGLLEAEASATSEPTPDPEPTSEPTPDPEPTPEPEPETTGAPVVEPESKPRTSRRRSGAGS